METGGGNKAGHPEDVDPAYHTQLGIVVMVVMTFQIRSSLFKGWLRLLAAVSMFGPNQHGCSYPTEKAFPNSPE